MYKVWKPSSIASSNGILPGEIISLVMIQQNCHLIPHLGPNESWPLTWTTDTVLDKCSAFGLVSMLIRHFGSKLCMNKIILMIYHILAKIVNI